MNTPVHNSRVALVTGASSGIGKATALQLLEDGLIVYVAARRVERMQDLEQAGAIPLGMDITDEDAVVTAVEKIQASHGGVDVLVNNAGYAVYGAMLEASGKGAYAQMAKTMADATSDTYANKASGPEVIAAVVSKAIRAKRPRTRYAAGYMARPVLFFAPVAQ